MINYLLVTPVKNEEKCLDIIINSIIESSLKPILWIIVDDCSSDNSLNIIEKYASKYKFIKPLVLYGNFKRDLKYRYSCVCKKGFEYAIQLSQKYDINWEYIALLDADIAVNKTYFKGLIESMEENSIMGICSGDLYSYSGTILNRTKRFGNVPIGGAKIWRKKCFLETGGYMISQAPDSISDAMAIIHGWNTKRFRNLLAYQLRETSSAEGLWKGHMIRGSASYYLNDHFLLSLGKGLMCLFEGKFYLIFPFFIGYFISLIKMKETINDPYLKHYFKYIRIRQRLHSLMNIRVILRKGL